MIAKPLLHIAALTLLLTTSAWSQTAIPVGKGSYADSPPPHNKDIAKFLARDLHLVDPHENRPIPTNHWWTDLLFSKFGRSLWAIPLKVDTSEKGVDIFYPTQWSPKGDNPLSESPLTLTGQDFRPVDSPVKDWSDWTVTFQMHQSDDNYVDVTLGEGMPYVWAEFHGVQPILNLPKNTQAKFFGPDAQSVTLPATTDCIGIEENGRNFGLFAPDGATFSNSPGGIAVNLTGDKQYLVICPLPTPADLAYFHQYAYAIPRDSRYSWSYDPARGTIDTTWKITTEILKGTSHDIIQGWIPHHYRKTTNDLKFNDLQYLTARGPMKCAAGNEFHISYPFNGFLPNLPAPQALGDANDFDPARMHAYFDDLLDPKKLKYGNDTYWGGKDILRAAQDALMTQQTNDPDHPKFVEFLRKAMTDWYTYTPGETSHYFAAYPKYKALVGVNTSYGSDGFNDHHFHYGYFTFATALLGTYDPQFLADYGPMARLVAKEYANWDHDDKSFPFMRTFDVWAGHGWASGSSSPGGPNEESSSEDVQSFVGLALLGRALNDKEMMNAGLMGYAVETQAVMEYWFNRYGDVFPPEWKHPITGMVWGGGKVYGTYFTGDPAWIYAIQWLPPAPWLSYLVRDPAFARKSYDTMSAEVAAKSKKPATIKNFGPALGNVMLGYVLMYNPAWACQQLDELWNEPGDQIAHNSSEMAIQYYMAHSTRNLGHVDWTCRTSSPISMVYLNDETKVRTYIVWNPLPEPEKVTVYENGTAIGTMTAEGQKLTSVTRLQ